MGRQSRSGRGSAPSFGRAPARPTVAPSRPSTQQTRPSTTAAYPSKPATPAAATPTATAPGQQQSSQGPGLLGQVASTAAGVAIGSSLGHAITGFFGGGSAPAESQDSNLNASPTADSQTSTNQFGEPRCDMQIKNFNKCMDEQQGNMSICNWYMEQLKQCQSAASPY